jgi:MFS family permease
MAYAGLGVAILLIAFVPTTLFVRERERTDHRGKAELPGLSLRDAMRGSHLFWFLMAAFFLASVGINGIIIHVVPILTDRGMPPAAAVAILSVSGIAGMLSRIVCGYVMDRFHAPYVGIGFFLMPMIGIALFATGWGGAAPLIGMIGIGMGLGAEIDLMSFLIGRYFGLRAFGALHGLIFSAFLFGQAGGASVLGWSQQLLGSYLPGFMALEVFFAVSCALLAGLGPYRFPARETAEADLTPSARQAGVQV